MTTVFKIDARLMLISQLLAVPFCCGLALAQELPPSDLWLLELGENGEVTSYREIAANGRYNNQPMFSHDGKIIYFTSEQEDGQTDIVRYNIDTGSSELVLNSPESEYSPTPIPGSSDISVVRVELPDSRQRLWRISPESGEAKLLLPNVEPIGYHTWIDQTRVALFILGDTFDLHVAEIGDGLSTKIASNIGRTLRMNPLNGKILFVDKNTEPWSIAEISQSGGNSHHVIDLNAGVEDFDVDDRGGVWVSASNFIFKLQLNKPNEVFQIEKIDFDQLRISRLTISGTAHLVVISAIYSGG